MQVCWENYCFNLLCSNRELLVCCSYWMEFFCCRLPFFAYFSLCKISRRKLFLSYLCDLSLPLDPYNRVATPDKKQKKGI